MKHIILMASFVFFSAISYAGNESGWAGKPGNHPVMDAQEFELSQDEFAKVTQDALSGQPILIDGKAHVADILDFKRREILLQEADDGNKIIRLKEIPAAKAGK